MPLLYSQKLSRQYAKGELTYNQDVLSSYPTSMLEGKLKDLSYDVLMDAFHEGSELFEGDMDAEPETSNLNFERKEFLISNLKTLEGEILKRNGCEFVRYKRFTNIGMEVIFNN